MIQVPSAKGRSGNRAMKTESGGSVRVEGYDAPLKGILFSASTEMEFTTLIPLIKALDKEGNDWALIYDNKKTFGRFSSVLNSDRCINVEDENLVRKIKTFGPEIFLTAHEWILLTVVLTSMMTSLGVPIIYIPHGLISSKEMPNATRVQVWRSNSIAHLFKYFTIICKTRAITWVVSTKVFPLIFKRPQYHWSYALVYDESAKAALLSKGVREERVVVTGHPRLDGLSSQSSGDSRSSTRVQYGVGEDEGFVLFMSQPFVEDKLLKIGEWGRTIDLLAKVTHQPKIKVFIRPHPRESLDKFDIIRGTEIRLMDGSHPLQEALAASDVVLTVNSTAALEAMSMGKPVISIFLDEVQGRAMMSLPEHIPVAKNEAELIELVDRSLTEPPVMSGHGGASGNDQHDGATKRIIAFIDHILKDV